MAGNGFDLINVLFLACNHWDTYFFFFFIASFFFFFFFLGGLQTQPVSFLLKRERSLRNTEFSSVLQLLQTEASLASLLLPFLLSLPVDRRQTVKHWDSLPLELLLLKNSKETEHFQLSTTN